MQWANLARQTVYIYIYTKHIYTMANGILTILARPGGKGGRQTYRLILCIRRKSPRHAPHLARAGFGMDIKAVPAGPASRYA